MSNLVYKYIKTIHYTDLYNWSIQYINKTNKSFNVKLQSFPIRTFLKRRKDSVNIDDSKEYKRVSIRLYNGGVALRDTEKGKNIGTKKQFLIKEGQFLLSKIDARNGAFGVVPQICDNAIITGNFWTFDVDYNIADPHFLTLLMTTKYFVKLFDKASNGTTNRHYLQEELFLNTEIPLPTLDIQKEFVKKYNDKIKLANEQEQTATELEEDIENYFLSELGLRNSKKTNFKYNKFLRLINSKDLYRWDILSINVSINNILNSSKYKLIQLQEHYNFVNRTWNKKANKGKYNYIEIGSVDPVMGVLETKEITSENAPSRATQIVKTNDLIIGTTRPYLKKITIINEKNNGNICSSGFSVIENSNKYNLGFLKEYLTSYIGIEQMKNKMTGGLYPAITTDELKKIKIPIPSLEIQNSIMSNIEQKRKQIQSLKYQAEQNRILAQEEFEKELFE